MKSLKTRFFLSLAMMAVIVILGTIVTKQVMAEEVRFFGYIASWLAGAVAFVGYMERREDDAGAY